ncbi:hypothetical protein HPB49_023766 [Dermacentor silvarum]|uniref:Uncharacterized protein n=1 Tax=Dermacentor silvarum TaxID=543639 RepID=A0ACB8C674_DERSI|nr:hypothetical protein HPB49_023766 [Dermacentor silvarum]
MLLLCESGYTTLNVSTFGEYQSHEQNFCVVEDRLDKAQYNGQEFVIQAVDVSFICKAFRHIPVEHHFIHTIEAESGPITYKWLLPGMSAIPGLSLVIGSNHMWKFVKKEIEHCKESPNFVAINNAFGWIFHCPAEEPTDYDPGDEEHTLPSATTEDTAEENNDASLNASATYDDMGPCIWCPALRPSETPIEPMQKIIGDSNNSRSLVETGFEPVARSMRQWVKERSSLILLNTSDAGVTNGSRYFVFVFT